MKYKGMICDRCGVKVTHSRVRRKRMGHIELAAPVVHIWFFKAMPSRLGTLLDMKTSEPGKDHLLPGLRRRRSGRDAAEGEAAAHRRRIPQGPREVRRRRSKPRWAPKPIKKLLEQLEPRRTLEAAREARAKTIEGKADRKQKIKDLIKRLKIVEALRDSRATSPSGWCWTCIPVIPPDLRPLVLLDSGNFATSDLNDLYRRIINRNNRLKKLVDLNAPEVIIRNEKRMLQQSVDALFDNNRCKRPVLGSSQSPAQVADRHDQGQAGPLPRKPARQARRLLGPFGHRRRPGTASCTSAACPRRSRWNCSSRSSSAGSRSSATPTRSSRPRRCSSARTTRSGTFSKR